jgi:predicted CXXCH cytochrome family protein
VVLIVFTLEVRRQLRAVIAIAPLLLLVFPALAGIKGSIHDFSSETWSGGEICNACHTPHNANSDGLQVPLWNHGVSSATYTVYSSSSIKRSPVQLEPGNISRLCLSCHDGTIAINSFGGAVDDGTSKKMIGNPNLGTDLSDDHPVGIYWDHQTQVPDENDCFACHNLVLASDGFTYELDPVVGNGLVFYDHRVECATCHDVHNTAVQDVKLLRRPLAGSAICLQCHPK